MKDHSKIHVSIVAIAFVLLVIAIIILPKAIAPHTAIGNNYKNVTVWTHVNITHSKPDVLNVTIYEAQNYSAKNITINAGGYKTVYCNATVRSWEGFNDITVVNASLFHVATSTHNASDNLNNHYTNVSCTINNSLSQFVGIYVCSFDVIYYSNNGTWRCNVTVQNSYSQINSNFSGSGFANTTFYPVYSLNVTDGIDYGGVAVEDYSLGDRMANLTNLGNMGINISVEGYGYKIGDGLAMNCSLSGNITVDNERFSASPGQAYGAKTQLSSSPGGVIIPGLTMSKQINVTMITNNTYWQLYVPPNPAGNCTGNVIFTAMAP